MTDFAAIDFETANEQRTSVCSVGIVVVRGGTITDRFYRLIRPEPEYYSYWNTRIHGLTARDTENAPVFPVVWAEAEPLIEGLPLVAHNSRFDEGCLKAVFRMYGMDYPDSVFLHMQCFPQGLPRRASEPSAADSGRTMRLRPHAAPPCPGRCRSLRRHRDEDTVKVHLL